MDKFGTGMYKSKMVDGSMYATSGKRFRKTKVKKIKWDHLKVKEKKLEQSIKD